MAAAVFRVGMVFYGVVLVMLVLCNSDTVTGKDTPNVTTTVTSKPKTPTTKSNVSSTALSPTAKSNGTTSSPRPTSSTVRPTTSNSTTRPTSTGTKSTPTSKNMTTPTAPGNHTVSSTNKMIPTPTPEGHGTDRGKWVATGFAVFFLITTIVMTVLYCRQRKIYRELEGDSSLSRLI